MAIQLGGTVNVELQAVKTVAVESVEIEYIIDRRDSKSIIAKVKLITGNPVSKTVVLWSGDAYDEIGQWTDEQANARVVEILTA